MLKEKVRTRKFAKKYVETGGNATQAMLSVSPNITRGSAKELGHRQLTKVDTKREIEKYLIKDKPLTNEINKAIATKTPKEIKWEAKHSYIETALKLKGLLGDRDKDKGNVNIAIVYKT